MILLWGVPDETPMAAVQAALMELGLPYVVVDQRRALEYRVLLADDGTLARLVSDQEEIIFAEVTSCYLRPYDVRALPAVARTGSGSAEWRQALLLDESLLCWAEMSDATVVNRPSSMLSNGSKPYQLSLIAGSGFAVPETVVTNDLEELARFCERHEEVIYKSISGVRSKVTRLTPRVLAERGHDLTHCPTQFQEYIAGVDYRVHVVGAEVFSCAIRSDRDDYRFASHGTAPEIVAVELPAEVTDRCRELTARLGLLVSGIDLRRTPEGRWYCFEANPSPAFSYYEQHTGLPIGQAIGRVLAGADVSRAAIPGIRPGLRKLEAHRLSKFARSHDSVTPGAVLDRTRTQMVSRMHRHEVRKPDCVGLLGAATGRIHHGSARNGRGG